MSLTASDYVFWTVAALGLLVTLSALWGVIALRLLAGHLLPAVGAADGIGPVTGISGRRREIRQTSGRGWVTMHLPAPARTTMPETFILIPGRTSRQGTTLNEGKFTPGYVEETSTLQVCPDDMKRLGLSSGDRVRLRSEQGQIELPCQAAKEGDLPPGLLFLPYGDLSSRLMTGDTQGTGMPNSKCFDVELEKV